jgi:PRTRC genetic system ThiF family protein
MRYHHLNKYLKDPNHRITVKLIGVGGTGSHILSGLAAIDYSLKKLNRVGLFVRAYDPDIVSEYNIGRQMFSKSDIGKNKAAVAVTRVNRYYNLDWIGVDEKSAIGDDQANIIVSAVDRIETRMEIGHVLKMRSYVSEYEKVYYWLDTGNGRNSGQIILGTPLWSNLPTFDAEFEETKLIPDDDTESCSMAEALHKQDLFMNKIIATYAVNMLWTLLHKKKIGYRGLYINLKTLKMQQMFIP